MDARLGGWVTDDTDGLAGSFACAGVGLGALSANGKATEVPNAAIAFDALQALEIHTDFTTKVAFDDILPILNGVNDLGELLFAKIFCANSRVNIGLGQNVFRVAGTNAVNVAQRDVDALIGWDFNADDTSHNE